MTGSIVNKNNVTMQITRDNILEGSLSFTNRCTANNSFDIGGCCIGSMEITLQGDYHHSLYNAVITLQQGVYVTGDSYHMEKVGTWIIKKAHWNGEWVTLECYDAMCLTQKKYSLTTGSFTPYSFFTAMCNDCGITLATTQAEIEAMVNGTATLIFNGSTQETDRKWSDLIHDMCAVICGFCSINRFGNLEVHQFGRCYKRIGTEKTYYTTAVDTLTKNDRITGGAFGNGAINITGLYINDRASKNADKSILVGNTTGTTLNLGYNRWLSSATSGYATMLQNILTQLTACQFYAADVHLADVSLYDLGDLITLQAGGELSLSEDILMCVMNIDYNFADESTISSYTFSEASDSSTSAVETNLTNRIETLESSQGDGGNKIYTSKSAPDNTLGKEGDLWVKYFVDYNDKLINSLGDEVDINLPRYESADDAYNYVDLTIRPELRSMRNLTSMEMNAFIKAFEGRLSIAAYQHSGGSVSRNITASQFPQLTVDTYTTNNQSFSVSRGGAHGWSDNLIYYRYIGVSQAAYCPVTNMDDFNDSFSDGTGIDVAYYYLYYNTSNKKFEYIYGQIGLENVKHTYWGDALWKKTSNISIDLLDTAYYTIDELYCKINDDWTLYESDDGSTVIVNQVLTSGTEIAQISVDGEVVSIYAPTPQSVSVTQTLASGTEIAEINVGDTNTKLYAPTTTVTQTLTEGTEIGEVNGTKLYAPSGGGSDVTVTPITTTGTNIANIAVNGTTYNLFAPTSGGGGGGSGSGYTETSLWSGTQTTTGTITLSDGVQNYDVIVLRLSPHQNNTNYMQRTDMILASSIMFGSTYQYTISAMTGTRQYYSYANCHFEDYTHFTLDEVYTDGYFKFTLLEITALKFGGGGGHNYSTEEQVIGTWIDGSTVYEKTQYGGITFSSRDTWYDTDITNIDKLVSVEGSILRGTRPINFGAFNRSIISAWTVGNHTLMVSMQAMASGETYTLNSITVRYTKTS
jgi:hypothetical protein